MKNKIVVCIDNKHEIYIDNFNRRKIRVGKAYKCVDELKLTSDQYYKPKFASLSGITIKAGVDKYGWVGLCLPSDCFRIATRREVAKYKIIQSIKRPFFLCKIYFFKIYWKIDRIVRRQHYREMDEFLEKYY